jgi:preprotein translocase subunit SecD
VNNDSPLSPREPGARASTTMRSAVCPIKGFATTLTVGIIASMFTALVVTRVVYAMITSRRHIERLSV